MANSPSTSQASFAHDLQSLEWNNPEKPYVDEVNPVKEAREDSTESHGVVGKSLWDVVESWMRSEAMQQRAKEIDEWHRCEFDWGGRRCILKGASRSPCYTANCHTCVDLSYALYPSSSVTIGDFDFESPDSTRRITTGLYAIQNSSRNGCQKCAIIFNGIKTIFMTADPLENVLPPYEDTGVSIDLKCHEFVDVTIVGFTLRFYSEHGCPQPFEAFGPAVEIPSKPSLKYCAELIQEKLAMCHQQHSCGQQTPASKLPKRVLDVTEAHGSQFIRLIETNDECEGDYVTLSHCWGQPPTVLETTKRDLPSRLHGIKMADLPPTFRDAALLTRHLGIRYLWIDSLCIIQDDKLDWEIESSKMADIYSKCTLCLSATASADSNGGCLFDRWSKQSLLPRAPMAASKILGSFGNLQCPVFIRLMPHSAHKAFSPEYWQWDRHPKSALMTRAWAFQERILSPRTVHFYEEEMVWECCTSITCECGYLEPYMDDNNDQQGSWKSLYSSTFCENKSSRVNSPLDVWLNLIEEFSQMHITHETDRLPALAGLASRLSQVVESDYLAGAWKTDLVRSIAWEREVPVMGRDPAVHVPSIRHLAPFSIPSWSWASIKSEDNATPQIIRFPFRNFDLIADKSLKILEAHCTQLGANKFGNVSAGFIRIRGALLKVKLSLENDKWDTHSVLFKEGEESFVVDVSCKKYRPNILESVYCLLLGSTGKGPFNFSYALVLREITTDTFERIGLVTISTSKENTWFGSSSVQTITLI